MNTIIRMGGASCAGKSTLVNLLNDGCHHLIDSPALLAAVEGRRISVAVPKTFLDEAEGGTSHGDWARHLLTRNNAQVLSIEETVPGTDFDLRVDGEFDVLRVQLVLPYFAWRARRDWRFAQGWNTAAPWVEDGTWELYQEYADGALRASADTLYVDVTDYPVREVSRWDAHVIFRTGLIPEGLAAYVPDVVKDAGGSSPDYQPALRVGSEWLGATAEAGEMAKRFNKTLPDDLSGAAVLDLGAAEGAFSLEALNRGATFVVAVDARERRLETLRRVRTAARLPVFTVRMRLGNDPLPNFVSRGGGRYDLALMLNILRHLRDPQARLREALSISNKLICETVTCDGDEAVLGNPPRQAFPPAWMRAIAARQGFRLDVRDAALQPERRRMYVFTRRSTE